MEKSSGSVTRYDLPMLAWVRRIIVSLGIGGASYLIMLAFMILSVVYDKELEPVITFAFQTRRRVVDVPIPG